MGYVEYAHPNQGSIYVKVMNGWELDELHNVYINSPANNEALVYESSTQLWKNKTIATALGYTPVTDARSISTSSPLSGGGDLTANRTISIADAAADGSTKGAAAFNANDFNSASGVISIDYTNGQAASGSNKGFLTSGDWTVFSGKFNTPTGTTAQYLRGDGSLATFPTIPTTYKSTTDTTAVTGNTNNNKVASLLIAANTLSTGSIINIKARVGKTGGAGITTLRVYINTADSIVTPAPTLIMTSATSVIGQLYNGIDRTAVVKSATNTQTAQATASIQNDAVIGNATLTASNIDWTQNQYLIFAIQNGAAGDSTVLSYYQIELR